MVTLRKAETEDCPSLYRIQVKAFAPLLARYQDFDSSPAAESTDDIRRRLAQPFTDYYLICLEGEEIGVLRVCDFGQECRISPICVLPGYQGKGYAREAMLLAETLYPKATRWTLNTIVQEPRLCEFYESLGYVPTGRMEHIKPGMDLKFYQKDVANHA